MEKTTVMATMAVLVGIIMVGSVLVPIVQIQSQETTNIQNTGAGWARFAYYEDAEDYSVALTSDGTTLSLGTQSGTADDMIVWASDNAAVIHDGGDFVLVYDDNGTSASADLGSSATVASASGTVTVTDSTSSEIYTDSTASWAYAPASGAVFGFFTDSGKVIKDFPAAAAGSFAGAYGYNEMNSLGLSDLVPTYSVSDGAFTQGDWELDTDTTAVSASYTSPIYGSTVTADFEEGLVANARVDPSTGTLVDDLYYTFSGTNATVVGISSSLSSATSITIPDTVTSGGTTYTVTAIANGTNASTAVFGSMTTLETVTFSANMTSISNYAFYGCTRLALTELPSGMTSIGSNAFMYCTNLALTELPSGMTSIGSNAFNGCTRLALTELPSGMTSINPSVFSGCTNLALTSLPSGLTSIGDHAFNGCTNLALTELPSGVTSIGQRAFQNCSSLALTELPSGVTSIGQRMFQNCSSLALTELPSGVTSIGTAAFGGCTNLALTSLPSGLTSIGDYAFQICTNLANLVINGSPSIDSRAFYQCSDLVGVVFTGSPTISNDSFYDSGVAEVLNLGDTEIAAGDYGLSSDCVVKDSISALGYIAPVSFSETVQKEGAEYDLMLIIPLVVIGGLLMASVVMFGLVRRSDY